jgi:hypothetical protein
MTRGIAQATPDSELMWISLLVCKVGALQSGPNSSLPFGVNAMFSFH